MIFLLVIIALLLIYIALLLRKNLKIKPTQYLRDTLHPVYSIGELKHFWELHKEELDEYSGKEKYFEGYFDAVSKKIEHDKNYQPSEEEKEAIKDNYAYVLRIWKMEKIINKMILTNIGVLNGSIKKSIEDADLDVSTDYWVSDGEAEKEYNAYLNRIKK